MKAELTRTSSTHMLTHILLRKVAIKATVVVTTLCFTAPTLRSQSATYLYLQGKDTLAVEQLSVSTNSWVGTFNWKGQPRVKWSQAFEASTIGPYTMDVFEPGSAEDAPAIQKAVFTQTGDTVVVGISMAGTNQTQKIPSAAGAYVLFNRSLSNFVLAAIRAEKANSSSFHVLLAQGGQRMQATLRRSADTLVISMSGVEMRARIDAQSLPVEISVPSQGVNVVRQGATASLPAAAPSQSFSYDAPDGAPYVAEHVRIPTERGYELAATLTKPKGIAKYGVAITISGSGPQDRDSRIASVPGYAIFREIADTLGKRGVATLRFDDRAVGESGGAETVSSATSSDFADDVRSIVTWLRSREDINASQIVLIGHSEGGIIAPMVAASDPKVRAVALLAGSAYDGKRIIMQQNLTLLNEMSVPQQTRDSIMATVPARLDSLAASSAWISFFMKHDPLPVVRQVKQPVLIVQGETDLQVSAEQADSIASALRTAGNKSVTLKKFASANHLFLEDPLGSPSGYGNLSSKAVRSDVLGAIADWVSQQVTVPNPSSQKR